MIREFLENEDESSSSTDSEFFCLSSEDTDTSSELVERRKLTRITNFVNITKKYDNMQFKEHFRLEKTTCNFVIDLLNTRNVLSSYKCGRENISPEKATYMTLWYLANTETFRQISDRFGVSKSSAHGIIMKVVNFLVNKSQNYIFWPSGRRKLDIIKNFKEKSGIDGIIGAVDGCHIQIKKPQTRHAYVYYNRNGYYSILLQAVCDCDKRFIDVFCGEAGSMHDSRLLKKSSLYERGNTERLEDNFLLGDSAYPSLNWLVPPFKDNGNLTLNEKTFNNRHSSTRVVIEHAFGLLKGRFRRLKFFENSDILLIVKCVVAATVLHNLCINFEDILPLEYEPHTDDNEERNEQQFNNSSRREQVFSKMFMTQ
ncbi:protein ALP1-like [Anoplophora glabripennis]|uniref:protein ALP1-like n=1 Tax=Anoplophora glabripennis TaxID=217634 RepID=UPI000874B452|nr:protein ALP1-like [Anoplophora glabripennis]